MRGEYVMPSMGASRAGELVTDWLARKKQAATPSHYRTLESASGVHVGPRWAAVSVMRSTSLALEAWIASMVAAGGAQLLSTGPAGCFSGSLTGRRHSQPPGGQSREGRGKSSPRRPPTCLPDGG